MVFQTKDRSDGHGVFTGAFHNALFGVGRKENNGCDLAQSIIGFGQASADKDDVRLASHDCFHIGFLDVAKVHNAVIGDIALKIVQRGGCRADHTVANAQFIQNVQRSKFEDCNALRVKGHFHIYQFLCTVERLDGHRFRCSFRRGCGFAGCSHRGCHGACRGGGSAAGGENTRCTHSGHSGQKRTTRNFLHKNAPFKKY